MKTNFIYEALNNVDNKYISEAANARSKCPTALMIGAASMAAALALVVGIYSFVGAAGDYITPANTSNGISYKAPDFGEFNDDVSYEKYGFGESDSGNDKFTVTANGAEEYYWDLYAYDITIPEAFIRDNDDPMFLNVKMRPDEIFAEFGVSPIMNENFLDVSEIPPDSDYLSSYKWFYEEPTVFLGGTYISFDYFLYDKNINKNVRFKVEFPTADSKSGNGSWCSGTGIFGVSDVITMKDGSPGFVKFDTAHFSHDAVRYEIGIAAPDDGDMEQVLIDLGVL